MLHNLYLRLRDILFPQIYQGFKTIRRNTKKIESELKTLEWWISGLMLNSNFFLISRLNMACSPHEFKLQKSQQIGIKDITFKSFQLWVHWWISNFSIRQRWVYWWISNFSISQTWVHWWISNFSKTQNFEGIFVSRKQGH